MEFDDICNTGLGLGLHRLPESCHQQRKKKLLLKYDHFLPSLTLGPSEDALRSATKNDAAGQVCESTDVQQQASSMSALSSFSNSNVKKERELADDQEVELERISNSRVSDEDEDGSPRKKLRLTKEQFATLEESFKEHSTLNPKQKQALAERLNLRPRQVEVWFQNRRARTKLKQTEVDCELLKRCCEALTEENKRLQKELQELKSLKLSAPLYMQLPAATLSLCPSCERLSSGGDGTTTDSFSFSPKPIYNSLTHPSAASC